MVALFLSYSNSVCGSLAGYLIHQIKQHHQSCHGGLLEPILTASACLQFVSAGNTLSHDIPIPTAVNFRE